MTLPKLGIDVSKRSFDVALLRNQKLRHKKFENSSAGLAALSEWLAKHVAGPVHAVMEATGSYGDALASFLFDAGHSVSIVNPFQIRAFAKSELLRNKTDRIDAAVIARFANSQDLFLWSPPPVELRDLQLLVRHYDDLVLHRSQLSNRLTEGRSHPDISESLKTLIAAIDQQIAEVRRQIRRHIDQHPSLKLDLELLTSIPGIGEKTAVTLLAEIQHLHDYKSSRQAVAFAGLSILKTLSGTSVRSRARLSKIGNSRVRKALYWPAITALRNNPLIRALAERLTQRGKHKLEVIGAAMRKLLQLAYGVLKSGKNFDENYASSH